MQKKGNHKELFRPQNRIDAALARIETSNILFEKKRFSASIYFAGVAVESVLRAFIERDSKKVNVLRQFADQCNDAANAIVARGYDLYYGE
mgnify:FL=1